MVTSIFPPSIGGIQSHTLRLAQELVRHGAEVHVVTRIQRGLAPFERMQGVRVHRVGIACASGAAGSGAFVAEATRALIELRGQIDVVHAHQLLSPTLVGLLSSAVARLPLVLNPHACGTIGDVGVLSATPLGRLRLRMAMSRADAFVAISRTLRDELIAAGAPPHRIWSIPNGVDTDRFSPASPRERGMLRAALRLDDAPWVVYTGRLAPEKGVDLLLSAWPRLLEAVPSARLCILGTGAEERALRSQAVAHHIHDSVTFAGGTGDVAPFVRAADVAVLPSRTEGMPVALLEAMSCGLPVVATCVGGSAEVLQDGVNGRLVRPGDPVALADGLAEALLDRDSAARYGAAARSDVHDRYGMSLVADRYLALYRALVTRRHGDRALAVAGLH
jgi:glycosyltransferase involved in cell wall biosynthesis